MDHKEEFAQLIEENKLQDAYLVLEKMRFDALEDPFYYGNLGWVLNHMEHYAQANIVLRKGIQIFPNDAWMYAQLGYCLDRQDLLDEGLINLNKSLKLGMDEAWIHGEIGWIYKEREEYQTAVYHFENGLLEESKNVFLLAQCAQCYEKLSKYEICEEYLKKCVIYSQDDEERFDLAQFFKRQNRFEEEISVLKTISDKKNLALCAYELSNAYFELQHYDSAHKQIQECLYLNKDDTGVRTLYGDILLKQDKIEEANQQYDQALLYYERGIKKGVESSYWIYQEMITIAQKQKAYKKKLSYLNRASEKYETTPWMMYHYARCYSDLQLYKKGADACRYCINHGDESEEMRSLYAYNLGRSKREVEAIEVLKTSIKINPKDDWAFGEIGWYYVQLSDYTQAYEYFEKALALCENHCFYLSMLGLCNQQLKQYEKAQEFIEKAIQAGRKDAWIYRLLAQVYEAQAQLKLAIQNYQMAQSLGDNDPWIQERITEIISISKTNQNK